nr:hypothetical protein [uncultured Flavobacterium sp.]
MEVIKQWISNGCDYKAGVEIYKNLKGVNKMLLRQFTLVENPQRKAKLLYELKKQLPVVEEVKPIIQPITEEVTAETSVEKETKRVAPLFHELPNELRPVLLEANNLFKENCLLKVQLNECAVLDEEKALQIIIQIDRNFRANQMCWDKINYWKTHKILPKETRVLSISSWSMDKLLKQQNLLGSSLSKMEKRLKENQNKLKDLEGNELQRIERLITKQEKEVIKKREELLKIKVEIDVKGTSN